MEGHAVTLIEVLAGGFWGGHEGLQLSNRLHARGALHLCYSCYLMRINHRSSSSVGAAWLLPIHSRAWLSLPVPRLLQIKDLVPQSCAKRKVLCHRFPS